MSDTSISNGWFSVKHGITNHPIFKGHPERLAIWIWLLDNAAWKDTPHDIRGKTIIVKRGSVCASERRIAQEVGVGYQIVRTFLERLKAERMINADVTHGRNVIALCNYEKYQNPPNPSNAVPNAPLTHDQRTKEQVNTIPPTGGDEIAAEDPAAVMFRSGRKLLAAKGISPRQVGTILGKWRKDHGEEAVISAIGRAVREGAEDPVAYIEGCLKFSRKQLAKPKNGDIRDSAKGQQIYDQHMGWMRLYA